MNDIIADLVNISSSHPSSPRFLLRILTSSPILHSFCNIPACLGYPVLLFGPFSHFLLKQGPFLPVKDQAIPVTTAHLCHCRAKAAFDYSKTDEARFDLQAAV